MADGPQVTVTFDLETAMAVRNALMTYRSTLDNVVADIGGARYIGDRRADLDRQIAAATFTIERACLDVAQAAPQ